MSLTGSVVSGIRGIVAPSPAPRQAAPEATPAPGVNYEEEMLPYGDGEEHEAFFNPLQAYDDMAELVVRGGVCLIDDDSLLQLHLLHHRRIGIY